jgi:hypothetical protein
MRFERLRGQALGFSRPSPEQPSTARAQGQTAAHTDRSDRALQLGDNYLAEVLLSGRGGLFLTALLEPLAPQTRPHLSSAGALRCRIKASAPLLSPAPDQDAIGERRARKLPFLGGQTIGRMAAP